MANQAFTLLDSFFGSDGATAGITRERNLMLNEGYRVIFISYNYNRITGKLKYAASIFRRDVVHAWSEWDPTHQGMSVQHGAVVFISDSPDATPYFEITEYDVENHIETTDRRFQIRPVKMTISAGLDYETLISEIRWEMIYGAGCKGSRSTSSRPQSTETVSSNNSYLSTDSMTEISEGLANSRTIHKVRYWAPDRDIFVAFKGLSSTGEVAYGACIHRRIDPDSRLLNDDAESHWATAIKRLENHPVAMQLEDEMMEFSSQLKRSAYHREDITQLIVDNIFDRRGGRIQVRSY